MTAQTTLTEDFNSVTIQKDGVNVSGWQTGNGLSNGWYLIGTGGIYTDDDYSTGYYGLISDGDGGKCIGYSYGTTNTAYLAVPDKLTGEVTFKARSTTTNSRYLSYVQVSLYEVNDDNTIGSLIETVKPSTTSWSSFSIDLGTEGKKVAVYMIRAAIDDFSATIYEDGAEVKAMAVTAFEALNTNVNADADGNYVAEFAVTVENKGNVDLTSADGAAISLLDASKNVIASMPVDVALDELVIVTINYEGTATQDGEVTFYVREDLSGKEFDTPVTITVQLAGARFAIDVIEGSRHDLGFVAQDGTAEKTFTITNSGNADLDVSFDAPDFLIVPSPLAVGADSSDEFSIGLSTETQGIKNGIVSLTGEKLYEPQFMDAVHQAEDETGIKTKFFVGFADVEESKYHFYYEFADEKITQEQAEAFTKVVDEKLQHINLEYESKRQSFRLHDPETHILLSNAYARFKAACLKDGFRDGQFKFNLLMQDEKRRTKFNMLQRWESRLERFSDTIIEKADKIDERRKERAKRRQNRSARSGRNAV